MHLVSCDVFFAVAIITESARIRDKQEREGRTVGIVAHLASSRHDRTMYEFLVQLECVTVQAELLDGHDQDVCRTLMTAFTHLGRKRTMLPVCGARHPRFPVSISAGLTAFHGLVGVRYAVEDEAEYLVLGSRLTAVYTGEEKNKNEEKYRPFRG
jgi:hypothetical protein